ncbi:MAG: NAD-dependent epimerase/dehydratase family protein [Planctomycetes bacterium]|nr:NAD-dependent epimerase/dehydratase family protein [Planctomycetota bacterium]
MKAVVTGAAGFIGSHLTERLLRDGWAVTGVDNFDGFYDPQVKRDNLAACLSHPHFRLLEADIRDKTAMEAALPDDTDVIVHLAARAGVRPSILEPVLYMDVNINGTVALLEIARQRHIGRFVFASSSSVYGNNEKVPFSETDNVDYPISPYAATKKAGELICHTYHHLYGLAINCLRFFTVYGPRQRPDLAIHKFARLIEAGKPIPVFGDGTMMRDFTYIDDIINGVVAAMDRCTDYQIYNLGESQPISVTDLITELAHALGKPATRQYLPPQPGDVERTYADIAKAETQLDYQPSTHIRTGLARFVAWLRKSDRR